MIKGLFKLGGEMIEVIIKGNELMFMDISTGMITSINGIRFSKAGVLKEFPDLKDNPDWKIKAINRLKEHMKNKKTEMEKMLYVKKELNKFGYEALHYQRAGHRLKKFE